tara:strand:+ start:967 stop:1278 length:312 start_codon:yes stop_codon:yes gene_type:complete
MNTQSELPLSSLLERAQYIKKAMGNIEEEITQKTFSTSKDGIHVSIKGSCFIDCIEVDPSIANRPVGEVLNLLTEAFNHAVGEIDKRRKQAFSEISNHLQDQE